MIRDTSRRPASAYLVVGVRDKVRGSWLGIRSGSLARARVRLFGIGGVRVRWAYVHSGPTSAAAVKGGSRATTSAPIVVAMKPGLPFTS